MAPFSVPKSLDGLVDVYPPADVLLKAIRESDVVGHEAISVQWLSEGIPYAFRGKPALYEAVRAWLAHELSIHPKDVTIIGSARQGCSLSPGHHVGRVFGPHSDLDLTIISVDWFGKLRDEFRRWQSDFTRGLVNPTTDNERRYWPENVKGCTSGIERGFLDPHKIPARSRYPNVQKILDSNSRLHKKLKATPGSPMVTKVSVRVYQDWAAFCRQFAINLGAIKQFAA